MIGRVWTQVEVATAVGLYWWWASSLLELLLISNL